MTCHEAREWLSDLLDDALDAQARAEVHAHLARCAECRRELDRLKATVSLLRAVERPRAPAAFVDRVLAAARPIPWHRRLRDWLGTVRPFRFPVEAAAVVLVASLAVYVFIPRTPEVRQAAPPEAVQYRAEQPSGIIESGKVMLSDQSDSGSKHATDSIEKEANESMERTARERISRLPSALSPPTQGTPPLPDTASAHVVGRLTVKDRQVAHRELMELLGRVGGAESARRADAGGDTVDLVIPRTAYSAFAQGLPRIGSWLPENVPRELSDPVSVTLRIAQ
jgi:hypothetical protein